MNFGLFLLVLVGGAGVVTLMDEALGTVFKGSLQRLVHIVAYLLWGVMIWATSH